MFVDISVVVQPSRRHGSRVRYLRGSILDRYRRARREAETGPDQPENPEDGGEDTRSESTETCTDHPEVLEDC